MSDQIIPHRRPKDFSKTGDRDYTEASKSCEKTRYIQDLKHNLCECNPKARFNYVYGDTKVLMCIMYQENFKDLFVEYYSVEKEDDELILYYLAYSEGSSVNQPLYYWKNVNNLSLDELAIEITEKMQEHISIKLEANEKMRDGVSYFNSVMNKLCEQCNVKMETLLLNKLTIAEIVNGEINVKFSVNGRTVEEPVDLNIQEDRLYVLEEILRVTSVLNLQNPLQEIVVKRRI